MAYQRDFQEHKAVVNPVMQEMNPYALLSHKAHLDEATRALKELKRSKGPSLKQVISKETQAAKARAMPQSPNSSSSDRKQQAREKTKKRDKKLSYKDDPTLDTLGERR